MTASSVMRKSCSFPNILVKCLNFILLLLSLSSVAPIILLRNPPASLCFAFLAVTLLSFLSSLAGLLSRLSDSFFAIRLTLLLSSLVGQVVAVVALFARERQVLSSLRSPRDPREAKALVRLECGVFAAMVPMQMMVSVLTCVLHNLMVAEFQGFEAEKAIAMVRKRNRRVATVEEGFVSSDVKASMVEGKTTDKHVKWVKTDFEG